MHSPFSFSRILPLIFIVLLAACGSTQSQTQTVPPSASTTPTAAIDAYGTPIAFPKTAPQRIISLIPSTSEILGALSLQKRVVAVDYYTNYPASLTALPRISDANSKYNVEQIVALKPDLVLSYGGETKQYDAQLQNLGVPVVDLPLANFSQSLQQILTIGRLTFTEDAATKLYNQLGQQVDTIKFLTARYNCSQSHD